MVDKEQLGQLLTDLMRKVMKESLRSSNYLGEHFWIISLEDNEYVKAGFESMENFSHGFLVRLNYSETELCSMENGIMTEEESSFVLSEMAGFAYSDHDGVMVDLSAKKGQLWNRINYGVFVTAGVVVMKYSGSKFKAIGGSIDIMDECLYLHH